MRFSDDDVMCNCTIYVQCCHCHVVGIQLWDISMISNVHGVVFSSLLMLYSVCLSVYFFHVFADKYISGNYKNNPEIYAVNYLVIQKTSQFKKSANIERSYEVHVI